MQGIRRHRKVKAIYDNLRADSQVLYGISSDEWFLGADRTYYINRRISNTTNIITHEEYQYRKKTIYDYYAFDIHSDIGDKLSTYLHA